MKADQLAARQRSAELREVNVCRAGIPGEQLERLSEEVDLLVVGSRRWGRVRRVLIGSTADRMLRHAACSVVVTPRATA